MSNPNSMDAVIYQHLNDHDMQSGGKPDTRISAAYPAGLTNVSLGIAAQANAHEAPEVRKVATTFEKNSLMNIAFGNPAGDKHAPNWAAIERQAKIMFSEAKEVMAAVEARDFVALVDGQGDVTVTNDGLAHIMGVDGDAVLDAVYQSNMSKFCANDAEVLATISKYEALGVELTVHGEFPFKFVKSAKEQQLKGETIPAGKFLKGISYREPDFTEVLK